MTSTENLATLGVNTIRAKLSTANYVNISSFHKTNLSVSLKNTTSSPDCVDVEYRDNPALAAFACSFHPCDRPLYAARANPGSDGRHERAIAADRFQRAQRGWRDRHSAGRAVAFRQGEPPCRHHAQPDAAFRRDAEGVFRESGALP